MTLPRGAYYSLTEGALSPFQAEPAHLYIGDRPEAVVLQFPDKVRVIKRGPDSGRRSVGLHLLALSSLNVWSIPKLREQEHNYGDNYKDPNKQQSLIDLLQRILKVDHVRSP